MTSSIETVFLHILHISCFWQVKYELTRQVAKLVEPPASPVQKEHSQKKLDRTEVARVSKSRTYRVTAIYDLVRTIYVFFCKHEQPYTAEASQCCPKINDFGPTTPQTHVIAIATTSQSNHNHRHVMCMTLRKHNPPKQCPLSHGLHVHRVHDKTHHSQPSHQTCVHYQTAPQNWGPNKTARAKATRRTPPGGHLRTNQVCSNIVNYSLLLWILGG